MCALCVHRLRIHAHPRCSLHPGAWSCISLACAGSCWIWLDSLLLPHATTGGTWETPTSFSSPWGLSPSAAASCAVGAAPHQLCCHHLAVFHCHCPIRSSHRLQNKRRNLSGHELWISAGDFLCSAISLGAAGPWLWFHWGFSWPKGESSTAGCHPIPEAPCGEHRGRLAQRSWFTGRRGTFTKPPCEHAVEFQMGIASVGEISQSSCVFHSLLSHAYTTASSHCSLNGYGTDSQGWLASKLFGVRNSLQVHGELKLGKLSGGPRASERLFLGTGYKSSPAAVSNL